MPHHYEVIIRKLGDPKTSSAFLFLPDAKPCFSVQLRQVLEASTSGPSREPFTARHVAPPRRHSGTSKKDEEEEIMSSLMRTRRWSSPETRRTRWGGTISSKKGRGFVKKQEEKQGNGSFLPPLSSGKGEGVKVEAGRVRKAWSEKGSEKGAGKGSGVRSPLATLSNFRGEVDTNKASLRTTTSKKSRGETAKVESDRVLSRTETGASEPQHPEASGRKQGEPCECNDCLECILRPRRRRGRPTDRSMMVTLSLPDDEGWAVQGTGVEEDGSTEWGRSEGYSDESGNSDGFWSESDVETRAETERGRKESWVDRPLTLEELENEGEADVASSMSTSTILTSCDVTYAIRTHCFFHNLRHSRTIVHLMEIRELAEQSE